MKPDESQTSGNGFPENNVEEVDLPITFYLMFWILFLFAVFGFLYNVSKVPTTTTFSVFFFDVLAVAYTNLLAFPFLIFITIAKYRGVSAFTEKRDYWASFFVAPFGYIGGMFIFRLLERLW